MQVTYALQQRQITNRHITTVYKRRKMEEENKMLPLATRLMRCGIQLYMKEIKGERDILLQIERQKVIEQGTKLKI